MGGDYKQKDRLAAVSLKSDRIFGSGGCECSSILALPAPFQEAKCAETGREEGECGGERRGDGRKQYRVIRIGRGAGVRATL
jgi:hypothetical protein